MFIVAIITKWFPALRNLPKGCLYFPLLLVIPIARSATAQEERIKLFQVSRWDRATAPTEAPKFPPLPTWFDGPKDFGSLSDGLDEAGFTPDERDLVLGGNWLRLFGQVFPA